MTDPQSHLGLVNSRARARHTADTYIILYTIYTYVNDSAANN